MHWYPGWLRQLIDSHIEQAILTDPRSVPGTLLGWPERTVFRDVLDQGRADFDQPIGHLSAHDRCLLYAKFNQPRHLDELYDAFGTLLANSTAGRPTVIDVGCGPFTAGLALAAATGPDGAFRYIGIDRAAAMLGLAEHLAQAAHTMNALHPLTTMEFHQDLTHILQTPPVGTPTIAVLSYLLASSSLDAPALVASLAAACDRIGPGPVALLQTNSGHPIANIHFADFSAALGEAGFALHTDRTEVFTGTRAPKALHYSLFFRPARTRLQL